MEEAEIVVTEDQLVVFIDGKEVQRVRVRDHWEGEWGCGVRVGRNILIAFKGELALGNFHWGEGRLRWVGCFEYPERLRANIICMQNSVDEMNMALAVQIFHKDSWVIEHFMFNLAALSNDKKFVNAFTRLYPSGS